MDPFGNSTELKEDIIPSENKGLSCPTKKQWIIILVVLGIVTLAGIFLIIFLSKRLSSRKKDLFYSEIICTYLINDCSQTIQLLSDEYENIDNSILEIFVNETKINYTKN